MDQWSRHRPQARAGSQGSDPNRGAVAILVAVFVVVGMILLAFVIDLGRVYVQRGQLQNAVDAAALAAAAATCQNPLSNANAVRDIAVAYAGRNGVSVVKSEVIVQDGVQDSVTGVSVPAQQSISQFFGAFAGVTSGNVAARATATRLCNPAYRMVSGTFISFSGGGTVTGPLYAGQCFRATGSGGVYDIVAVSTQSSDTTTCAPPAGSRGIEPGSNTVTRSDYGVPQPTLAGSYAGTTIGSTAGWTEADMNAKLSASLSAGTDNCNNFTQVIICNGSVSIPANRTVTVNVLATGVIKMGNNAQFNGQVMYTTSPDTTSPPNYAMTVKAGGNAASVYYAPNGTIQGLGAGSASENTGILIANAIDYNGGSQSATGGSRSRTPGSVRLTQ